LDLNIPRTAVRGISVIVIWCLFARNRTSRQQQREVFARDVPQNAVVSIDNRVG